jgi:hypothetical protein
MPAPGTGGVQTSLTAMVARHDGERAPRSAASRDQRQARRFKAPAATRPT